MGDGLPSDAYVLLLPMALGNSVLTALAFIGAMSAATGMVVVASVTLSIMISNELVVPIWLKLSTRARGNSGDLAGKLRLYDATTGEVIGSAREVNDPVRELLFHPDGYTIASVDRNQARFWSVPDLTEVAPPIRLLSMKELAELESAEEYRDC